MNKHEIEKIKQAFKDQDKKRRAKSERKQEEDRALVRRSVGVHIHEVRTPD